MTNGILDQILNPTSSYFEPTFENFANQIPEPQENFNNYTFQPPVQEIDLNQQPPQQQQSNFSVFSNIAGAFSKIAGNANQIPEEDVIVPPPAGIESLISQEVANAPPVPLFPANTTSIITPVQPTTNQGDFLLLRMDMSPTDVARAIYFIQDGRSQYYVASVLNVTRSKVQRATSVGDIFKSSVNNFRRATGLKRPTYAKPPELTSPAQPPQTNVYTPPQPPVAYFQPQPPPSISPAGSSSSYQDTSVPYQFKPIAPTPSIPSPISQPTTQKFPYTNSFDNFSSPVMSAIPASEMQSNQAPIYAQGAENYAPPAGQIYRPVYQHWFYKKEIEGKIIWKPFSMVDSLALESAFTSNDLDPEKFIATDGGRFDVNILRRQRKPVYWKGEPSVVQRCSWFHKGQTDGRFIPYDENVATKLEEEFKIAFEQNQWHRKVELSDGETVVFHAPDVLVLFPPTQAPDAWGNTQTQSRARLVKRGMDEFDIDEGEPATVDHVLFMVHGIGSVCDLKFRTVEEVVDEFRSIALQLVQSHYKSSCERGISNKVEVLPISWHDRLHSEETGIDKQLKNITLDSIPRLRDFTNDTLLDILFYTSPIYCQTIISTVGNELNRVYNLFKQRNPSFKGGISLGGHSLGSLILFDLLGHQKSLEPEVENPEEIPGDEDVVPPLKPSPAQRKMSRRISYMMGAIGTGQPQIHYPQLDFHPKAFFALGSPIGMFVTIRGLDTLGVQFSLPTCPAFFNIFHPYDPVAYRVESLVNPDLSTLKPVLIPHHKGRKRMHLELKETMAKVGADLKQKVIESMKSTWNSVYQLAMFHRADQPASLEEEVNKAFEEQLQVNEEQEEELPQEITKLPLGQLNNGRRIDYVLQEAPFEFINEYIFALTSHVGYWESEDTILLMLKEIYTSMGVTTDSQIPQQTMTIERPPPSPRSSPKAQAQTQSGMDPTQPIQGSIKLGPPPTAGFMRKT
ncbi:unnamed protein product [Brassicogethes aeneus]|uniref:DDHD domain-containing protein n=1 Tax=Brassicogethes aeneus TaxID=1431903 RepID=A0A9P0BHI8_BRAAE|nr:unnamed protein product [Brassicogethes aeneus]